MLKVLSMPTVSLLTSGCCNTAEIAHGQNERYVWTDSWMHCMREPTQRNTNIYTRKLLSVWGVNKFSLFWSLPTAGGEHLIGSGGFRALDPPVETSYFWPLGEIIVHSTTGDILCKSECAAQQRGWFFVSNSMSSKFKIWSKISTVTPAFLQYHQISTKFSWQTAFGRSQFFLSYQA